MSRSPTGGVKHNDGKSRLDLIPGKPLIEVGHVMAYGADKYAANNWRLGLSYSETMGSILRHLVAFNEGDDDDPESGLSHLAHAAAQVLYLLEFHIEKTGIDDRWSRTDHDEAKL